VILSFIRCPHAGLYIRACTWSGGRTAIC